MEEKLYDLNNYWKLTKSQKIKRSDNIINMIAEMVDNNQYIKRFMRYYSNNPLANRSEDNNGKTIKQPNLKDSLMEDTNEVKSPISEDSISSQRCLFTWGFNDNLNVDAFIEQAESFKLSKMGIMNKIVEKISIMDNAAPWMVRRAAELLKWYKSGEYDVIIKRYGV